MINLSQIENLSAREGKTLDYSKVKTSVTAGLKESNIIAYTSQELRKMLGIEKEYKNLGAYYHLCNKLSERLKVKTVINRQVIANGNKVRVVFFSNLEKEKMFTELERIVSSPPPQKKEKKNKKEEKRNHLTAAELKAAKKELKI